MNSPFEPENFISSGRRRRALDWDETAADTALSTDEIYDRDRPQPKFFWLWLILAVCFLALGGRVFYLQIVRGKDFRALSENNRIRSQDLLAPRGKILDRYGEPLAENTASFNLVATPFDLPKSGLDVEVQQLAADLKLDLNDLNKKLAGANRVSIQPLLLAQDLSLNQSILFETKATQYIGFSIQKIPIRQYQDAPVFSHVVGYTGLVGPGELDSSSSKGDYSSVDYIGKTGVEKQYEKFLHGQNGRDLVEVDAAGKVLDVLGEDQPVPGQSLMLNIDKGLQEELYRSLAASPAAKAAAVAVDPRNGQVLALVSLPGFDNNLFAHGISGGDYQTLVSNKNQPLFDRAIAGTYPPGSTVKPMVATAALQNGIISDSTVIYDNGVLTVPNQFDPSQSYQFHGWKPGGLGPMTVRSAIAMSSDIFFYTVAGGYPHSPVPDGLGAQRLADYFRKFNVGSLTGIDLQGEQPGLVPDPAWKEKYFHDDPILSKWYLGDTYHLGIGQGDLLVTPLQVAEWTSIIANNGVGYKPEIGQKVVDQSGNVVWQNQPQVLVSNVADLANLKIVQEGMRQTVLAGTARALQSLPISSAGKTGTSQFDGSDPKRTHAWFTVYAPYEDPQIVVTVLVEAGGEGNAVAEPVARDALLWWAQHRYQK
ncbi:MAG: penicillin-binding protein 2 [Patescibacteria group bacterium]|nr:penicillin-binding protein 2 [Patescibacteria group bacterium]